MEPWPCTSDTSTLWLCTQQWNSCSTCTSTVLVWINTRKKRTLFKFKSHCQSLCTKVVDTHLPISNISSLWWCRDSIRLLECNSSQCSRTLWWTMLNLLKSVISKVYWFPSNTPTVNFNNFPITINAQLDSPLLREWLSINDYELNILKINIKNL